MSDKSDAKNEKRKKSGGEGEKRERKSVNTAKAQRAPRESAMRLRASNVYFFHANNSFYSLSYLGRFGRPIIRTDQPTTEKNPLIETRLATNDREQPLKKTRGATNDREQPLIET